VGHICEEESARLGEYKKNYHNLGKAVRFTVANTPPEEVFQFLERIPQVKGLGLDLDKKQLYFDLRDKISRKWVWDGSKEEELTPDLRARYNLGEPQPLLFKNS